MPRLVHVSADDIGYTRRRRGKRFQYLDEHGHAVHEQAELDRIQQLRIPPAWKKVWICKNPDGHLQATGIDSRGRKQYLYHEEWSRRSLLKKFDRMAGFAKALPSLRKKIQYQLNKEGWPYEKVISLIIALLDQSSLRIGNKMYEIENGTYGLTTLRRKHLKMEKGSISFQFKAKGGLYRQMPIQSKKLSRLIKECSELPGQEVFRYLDDEGKSHPIFSQDVNAYLQEIMEGDYTAKDFRTWGGTVGAVELYPEAVAELQTSKIKQFTTGLIKKVAEKLGNTAKVCRDYYIHPATLALSESAQYDFDDLLDKAAKKYPDMEKDLNKYELAALYLIEQSANR